jgi:Cu+-exporting ATPase
MGRGVSGTIDGHRVVIGSASFVAEFTGPAVAGEPGADLVTWAAVDDRAPGTIRLSAPDRAGMRAATAAVAGRYATWLLSGDHATEAPRWAASFGDRMKFRQSPSDKLDVVRAEQSAGRRVLMIGDGLNDAGALAAADVGMAVSDETACLVPACDAVIRGDRLPALPALLAYARRARRVIIACFAVSLAYNAVGLSLALTGRLSPLATAILMPVSSLTIVAISVGAMRLGAKAVR